MTASPATLRIPRVRWGIGVLLGGGVLINYFDRINLSVGAPQLQQEFGLTDGELGWLFSGFFWSYALLQIPTGMILDRFERDRTRRRVWWHPPVAPGVGRRRGARISRERQGHRLLVSAWRASHGDGDFRCRRKVRQCHRRAA